MTVESAKAKLDAQEGDPATGYISKADHQDSYDELVDDTALTGATTAEGLTVNGRDVDDLVAGPASATDNALARFDGTGGKTVQDSGITVDDSNNLSGVGTINGVPATGPLHPVGYYGYIGGNAIAGASNSMPSSQGGVALFPFMNPHEMTVSQVRMRVYTAAAAGAVWRVGLYAGDPTTTLPTTLVAEFGTVDPTSTGVKSITGLSATLPAGLLWQAVTLQGSGAGGGTFYSQSTSVGVKWSASLSATYNGLSAAGVSGALPNPITATGTYASIGPGIPAWEYLRSA